ncbi:MAG: winged helix-turn-helix transcriptional regulator [Chloroflexi bacterium]|nr:winged helix-turn-helix transcriptional regulator [Chloroflexota bacterium]
MPHRALPLTFRFDDTHNLLTLARAGESAAIIGLSGVGKSNFFTHVANPAVQRHHLGSTAENLLLVCINCHYAADFTSRSLYSLILEQLEAIPQLTAEQRQAVQQHHETLLSTGDDKLRAQRYFKLAIRTILADTQFQLAFFFDQFQDVYQQADSRFFAHLRGLRDEYKYRLCYFIFSRYLPDTLEDPDREEFGELFLSHTYGLKPYNLDDAATQLHRFSRRYQFPAPTSELIAQIHYLTGGHNGMLRAVYMAIAPQEEQLPAEVNEAVAKLLTYPPIAAEVHKIWYSLTYAEQLVIHHIVRQQTTGEPLNAAVVHQMQLKGLLANTANPPLVNIPLLAHLASQQEFSQELVAFDPQTQRVSILGRSAPPFTPIELRIFQMLYDRAGELISSQEICQTVWNDLGADSALKTNIRRLRKKIEPDPTTPRFLLTQHGLGYQLNLE